MLAKYHFEIKHVKKSDNAKANAFNKKKELQRNNKMSKTLFKKNNNGKIKYNYLQLSGTHKALISL